MSCEHPYIKAITSYRYGCRCNRCRQAKTEANTKANRKRSILRKHRKIARSALSRRKN